MIFRVNINAGDMSKHNLKEIELISLGDKYKTIIDDKAYYLRKLPFFKFIFKEYKIFTIGTILLLLAILFLKPIVFIIYTLFALVVFNLYAKKKRVNRINQLINVLWIIHAILSISSFIFYKNIYTVEAIGSTLFYGMFTFHIVTFWLKLKYQYDKVYVLLEDNQENETRHYIYRSKDECGYYGLISLIRDKSN